ncbi:putative RNA binding protein Pym, partial [Aspergillus aculeatinus CBS 121060]
NKTGGVTSSGIATNETTGERYIPSSTRADGSKRREIRVRPGYRPPEDVELYKNRAAEAWKNRGKTGGGGVPGAEGLKPVEDSDANKSSTAASNKNAKRREARKKAKATGQDSPGAAKDVTQIENWRAAAATATTPNGGAEKEAEGKQPTESEQTLDPEAENEKKARNLKKKLRQARDLRDKKNQGEALLPEQLEKVIKIQELVRQLDALGFDANGDKRDASAEEKGAE